jgi:hypothetical protein
MRSLLFALLALAASGCGPVLFAEAEFEHVCLVQTQAVPGAPGASGTLSVALSVPLVQQIPLLTTQGAENELVLDSVTVSPTSGGPDLSGIDSAVVSASGTSGPPVEAARYTRGPPVAAPTEIVARGENVDLAPLLVAGNAQLQLAVSGRAPAAPWVANVTACVHGKSKVPYP